MTIHRSFSIATATFRPILATVAILLGLSSAAMANNDGGGGDDGDDVFFGDPIAGIDVDAQGVLKVRMFDPTLAQKRLAAARDAAADQDVMRASDLRKV